MMMRRKYCALSSKGGAKKIRPAADPLPGGAGRPKFNQLDKFRVIVVTDPQSHKHTTPVRCEQTGPRTIHCAAKLSAQCN